MALLSKKMMGFLYGMGAAVVIVGALFKLMHWPGAGPMLVVGLLTEAFIFALSAFEPVEKDLDWSLVYPELAGGEAKAKDKNDPFRLMGFGHRVYKNFDPRAKIIKVAADNVLEKLGINDPILDIAKKLEQAALEDEYFKSRNLYPNVDFYSGIIYRAMGIPVEMFTVLFAIGRLPGWIAQWKEMRVNKEPIGRPRQVYTGYTLRPFKEVKDR